MHRRLPTLLLALSIVAVPARAVILYGTADPEANTTAPTGALAGSGWQFQGQFGRFLGTPIAPDLFLTARHIGGETGAGGTPFVFNGASYPTVAEYNDPASDLRVIRVAGTFPAFAPLFPRQNPAGEPLVVFGRGTQRGDPVTGPADTNGNTLKGWLWGPRDTPAPRPRYGTNVVTGTVDGGTGLGRLLYATFDAAGGSNEAHLSDGDSGGGVFLRDTTDGAWKLAGINYGVSGPYSRTADGADAFNAAIFQGDGLFENDGPGPYVPARGPGALYATEVAARLDFLRLILGQTPLARIGADVLYAFPGESGKHYRVERRDDLASGTWETVPGADNLAGSGGPLLVTDPGAASLPRRFYRAVTLP